MTCVGVLASTAAASLVLVSVATASTRATAAANRDPFAVAAAAIASDRSEKVRVQAGLVLTHLGDPRVTPVLIRALASDRSAAVRAVAAIGLGQTGDPSARGGLETATSDKSPLVRRHAVAALHALDNLAATPRSRPGFDVKAMGDRSQHASPALRARMRQLVARELKSLPPGGGDAYVVDGAIKTLATSRRPDLVEVKCAVELVLSTRRDNAIVMMSSGEASVERPRRQFRPAMRAGMEVDALEHAVRGASDELRQHFAVNGR